MVTVISIAPVVDPKQTTSVIELLITSPDVVWKLITTLSTLFPQALLPVSVRVIFPATISDGSGVYTVAGLVELLKLPEPPVHNIFVCGVVFP